MKRLYLLLITLFSMSLLSAQNGCVHYTLSAVSNVNSGAPTSISFSILSGNQFLYSQSLNFDSLNTNVVDTFCTSGACNLTLLIDPLFMPPAGTFSIQISAFGSPLQFLDYQEANGVIVASFCATVPCPSYIQIQESDCDSYTFYAPAYSLASNVDWNFGDGSVFLSGGPYQAHSYIDNGIFVASALIDNPGCGAPYNLLATVNVDCPVEVLCPTQLQIDSLTCQDFHIHFDTQAPGSVQWQIDGNTYETANSETYITFENGWHEIIAVYIPTGTEGCTMGGCPVCPITFYDTITVYCDNCEPVFMAMTSVPELGGTGAVSYTLSSLDLSETIVQSQAGFSSTNPVVELAPCLQDGCYLLHICSPTPLADSNFVVDVVDPMIIYQSQYFEVSGCYGLDVVLSLNTDCAPPPPVDTCSGERLRWSAMATYLTMPPVFNPDTLNWTITDVAGMLLDQGDFITTDLNPSISDSICAANPLTCYFLNIQCNDQIWGAAYMEIDANMLNVVHENVWINVTSPQTELDFLMDPNSCPNRVDEQSLDDVKVFPNPADEHLQIQYRSMGEFSIELIASDGRCVRTWQHLMSENVILNLEKIPAGVYAVRVMEGAKTTVKMMIKN